MRVAAEITLGTNHEEIAGRQIGSVNTMSVESLTGARQKTANLLFGESRGLGGLLGGDTRRREAMSALFEGSTDEDVQIIGMLQEADERGEATPEMQKTLNELTAKISGDPKKMKQLAGLRSRMKDYGDFMSSAGKNLMAGGGGMDVARERLSTIRSADLGYKKRQSIAIGVRKLFGENAAQKYDNLEDLLRNVSDDALSPQAKEIKRNFLKSGDILAAENAVSDMGGEGSTLLGGVFGSAGEKMQDLISAVTGKTASDAQKFFPEQTAKNLDSAAEKLREAADKFERAMDH